MMILVSNLQTLAAILNAILNLSALLLIEDISKKDCVGPGFVIKQNVIHVIISNIDRNQNMSPLVNSKNSIWHLRGWT